MTATSDEIRQGGESLNQKLQAEVREQRKANELQQQQIVDMQRTQLEFFNQQRDNEVDKAER